jgi:undecaprenyl-diphosphatase
VDLLGFRGPPGRVFEIVIQLGAILAIVFLYWGKFWSVLIGLPRQRAAQRFTLNIVVAFLPAALIGVLAHDFIKDVLFSPWTVSIALVVGGVAILLIERGKPAPQVDDVDRITPMLAVKIGLCQVVAMIPGVSRSGATILGAMLLGVARAPATEFSFFLAVPTMIGATAYDLAKNWNALDGDGALVLAVGLFSAFMAALVVVRSLVAFVSRRGFAPFAWYRIALGSAMLLLLLTR